MNQKRNYQKEMEKVIDGFGGEKKTLLLHSCCAPCNSAVLEKLQEIFALTVFFYNPNITEKAEYERRIGEQRRLVEYFNEKNPQFPIKLMEGNYEPAKFLQMSKGLEKAPEGGERCYGCYGLRLEESARVAKEQGFDYFTTSLTISPMKNAEKLSSENVQSLVKKLQKHITDNYYNCSNEILKGLGQMYILDKRFKTNIDKHADGTAEFVSKAIEIFCNN